MPENTQEQSNLLHAAWVAACVAVGHTNRSAPVSITPGWRTFDTDRQRVVVSVDWSTESDPGQEPVRVSVSVDAWRTLVTAALAGERNPPAIHPYDLRNADY